MAIQAFIDESIGEDGTIVMGGHVAPAHKWAAFAAEWEAMLNFGLRDERGYYFHMAEMAQLPERMSRVPGFYRLIEKHVGASISIRFNVNDLKRAKARLYVPGIPIDWGFVDNPWVFAFRGLMDMFHANDLRAEAVGVIPPDAVVDFIFDDTMNKRQVRAGWDFYLAERKQAGVRVDFGKEPRFEDDRSYLPLQAADLWVWWVRKWHSEGVAAKRIIDPIFEGWEGSNHQPGKMDITFTENDLALALAALVRARGGPQQIYDLRPSPPSWLAHQKRRGRSRTP